MSEVDGVTSVMVDLEIPRDERERGEIVSGDPRSPVRLGGVVLVLAVGVVHPVGPTGLTIQLRLLLSQHLALEVGDILIGPVRRVVGVVLRLDDGGLTLLALHSGGLLSSSGGLLSSSLSLLLGLGLRLLVLYGGLSLRRAEREKHLVETDREHVAGVEHVLGVNHLSLYQPSLLPHTLRRTGMPRTFRPLTFTNPWITNCLACNVLLANIALNSAVSSRLSMGA